MINIWKPFLNFTFLLAGPAIHPSITIMSVCYNLREWAQLISKDPVLLLTDPLAVKHLELLPPALHYCFHCLS